MNPKELPGKLMPSENNPLHFKVPGTDYAYKPYWDIGNKGFSCLPIIE
jgi:hypothetical protein